MSLYLQFDSLTRSDPYIQRNLGAGNVWVPNDNYPNNAVPPFEVYQMDKNIVQTPTNYSVYYRELNDANNVRTIGFLAHCKERPTNLTYSVEACTLTLPIGALVKRVENGVTTYVNILNEPYVYVRMVPINHAEGNLIYSNNSAADGATFIMWLDKTQLGATDDSPPIVNPIERPNVQTGIALSQGRWLIYKTCMITVMRLDLQPDEWQIRIYDRFGNDIVVAESDNGGVGFPIDPLNPGLQPDVDPDLQTMLLVGIKPNYPL